MCAVYTAQLHGRTELAERRVRASVEWRSDARSHPSDDDATDGSVLLSRPERTGTEL
jgi:hypothetical protein